MNKEICQDSAEVSYKDVTIVGRKINELQGEFIYFTYIQGKQNLL